MPLGTKVGLSPGDTVLDRDPASLPTKGVEPISATAELLLFFVVVPRGRLSWLFVSFWAHVNIVVYRISYRNRFLADITSRRC